MILPFKTFISLLIYAFFFFFFFFFDSLLSKFNPIPADHSHFRFLITIPNSSSSRIPPHQHFRSPNHPSTDHHTSKLTLSIRRSMAAYGNNKPSLNRSLTIASSTTDVPKKPYLYQPFDRSNTVRRFYNNPHEIHIEPEPKENGKVQGTVKQLCSMFESRKSNKVQEKFLTGTEDRIVVYFTSLRGVRRTYEDCYAVCMIFRGFRVYVDERDVSMDIGYRRELLKVLNLKTVTLPQVFIRGVYVGGVDAVKQLHETGQLLKMVQGLPIKAAGYVCQACGDVRFMPCLSCSGSKKIYDEEEDMMKRCRVCNENGLIRCPKCCL